MDPKSVMELVETIMDDALPQVQTQVQFAFEEIQDQDVVTTFCVVGTYWKAMDFRREQILPLPPQTIRSRLHPNRRACFQTLHGHSYISPHEPFQNRLSYRVQTELDPFSPSICSFVPGLGLLDRYLYHIVLPPTTNPHALYFSRSMGL